MNRNGKTSVGGHSSQTAAHPGVVTETREFDSRAAHITCLLLVVLLLSPVLAVEIPAMLDYPDHLARMYLLSRDATAAANPFYQISWALYPNLAMDIAVPWLAHFVSVENATKAFYLISQVLVAGGACMVERVVKGRVHLALLAAVTFLYSPPFAWGFVNFEFGFGIALWAIAIWLATERMGWPARVLVHSIFVLVLFLAHFFALGLYGLVIGLHQLWRSWIDRAHLRDSAIAFSVLAAPVAAIVGAMVILGGSIGRAGTEWYFAYKPAWIALAMSGYSSTLSEAGMLFLISLCFVLARRGQFTLVRSGGWIAVGLALTYVVMPFRPLDTAFADVRILTAAAFVLPAFVQISIPNATWRRILFSTTAAFAVVNLVLVWSEWLSFQPVALQPAYRHLAALQGRSVPFALLLAIASDNVTDPPAPLASWP